MAVMVRAAHEPGRLWLREHLAYIERRLRGVLRDALDRPLFAPEDVSADTYAPTDGGEHPDGVSQPGPALPRPHVQAAPGSRQTGAVARRPWAV